MTVSYESTVREMDAEELEAEYAVKAKQLKNTADISRSYQIIEQMEFISCEYQQLTGKPLTDGHLPTAL